MIFLLDFVMPTGKASQRIDLIKITQQNKVTKTRGLKAHKLCISTKKIPSNNPNEAEIYNAISSA
jgi:hypothetical protein